MYLVVGAGLAGMSAAITLQKSGDEVVVVEASDRAGGRVASDLIDLGSRISVDKCKLSRA